MTDRVSTLTSNKKQTEVRPFINLRLRGACCLLYSACTFNQTAQFLMETTPLDASQCFLVLLCFLPRTLRNVLQEVNQRGDIPLKPTFTKARAPARSAAELKKCVNTVWHGGFSI